MLPVWAKAGWGVMVLIRMILNESALKPMNKYLLCAVLCISMTSLSVQPAMAQNISVNTLVGDNDGSCDVGGTGPDDDCSLLEALDLANSNADAAHIEFSISGTIHVDDEPNILTPITLDGTTAPAGTRSVIISRDVPQGGFERGVLVSGAAASGSVVQGMSFSRRLLGSLGNTTGVRVEDTPGVRVGGSAPAQGNAFVDTDFSIQLAGAGSSGAIIRGNQITGNNQGSFDYAITVDGSPNAMIGGTGTNDGNTILNVEYGIFIAEADSSGFTIVGNTLTNVREDGIRLVTGMTSGSVLSNTLTNNDDGIVVESFVSGIVIGGMGAGEGNIITGGNPAIRIGPQSSNIDILGNQITTVGNFGIKVDGNAISGIRVLGNQVSGPFIAIDIYGVPDAVVGGTGVGEGNIISDTEFAGIRLQRPTAERASVMGNQITGDSETGIYVDSAINNVIGGTGLGEGNVISGPATGIFIYRDGANNNAILGNSITNAAVLGIDLTSTYPGDGVTPNDPAPDTDTGANGLQNFPVITDVAPGVEIDFSLASMPLTTFRIEAFASSQPGPSGFGPGERFLGFVDVSTDGSGNATGAMPAASLLAIEWVTMTATAIDGSSPTGFGGTSEFSAAVQAGGTASSNIFKDSFE